MITATQVMRRSNACWKFRLFEASFKNWCELGSNVRVQSPRSLASSTVVRSLLFLCFVLLQEGRIYKAIGACLFLGHGLSISSIRLCTWIKRLLLLIIIIDVVLLERSLHSWVSRCHVHWNLFRGMVREVKLAIGPLIVFNILAA